MVRKMVREEVFAERDILHAGRAGAALELGDAIDHQEAHYASWRERVAFSSASMWSNNTSSPGGSGSEVPHAPQMNSRNPELCPVRPIVGHGHIVCARLPHTVARHVDLAEPIGCQGVRPIVP